MLNQAAEMHTWPVFIDETAAIRSKELVNRVRLYVRRHKIELLVLDYIQLVQGQGRDIRERVSHVANVLRVIAKEEGIALIVLSQLSRPGDINERPTMLKLRESGDIEANAHTVLLLYQPIDTDTAQPTGYDEIIIGKQRNGPLSTIPVAFHRKKLAYVSREIHYEER
jgi:replicative DNA helicase